MRLSCHINFLGNLVMIAAWRMARKSKPVGKENNLDAVAISQWMIKDRPGKNGSGDQLDIDGEGEEIEDAVSTMGF